MSVYKGNKIKGQGASRVAITGMAWSFLERISAQLVTFVVSIVLARLLTPDEYGVVAIVLIFVTIADIFVTAGFGSALVQKLDVDNIDFSTTFFFSIGFSLVVYTLLFFCAPLIANFYEMEELTLVIRVMSVRIVFASVNSVQQAYVSRQLEFKKFFYSTLVGAVVSAVVGIAMAYLGYGVWALVAQYLVNVIISTVVLWCISGWRPIMVYSWSRMKGLFSFGWKVMVASVYHTLGMQARSLVLGKLASPRELSFYNQGEKFPALFINNIETSIQKVLAPILSSEQEDKPRVLDLTRKSMRVATFTIWPLLIGLAAVAESLIEILFTTKWMGSVPYLKLICIAYMFYPVGETHVRTIRALGRSDTTMWTIFIAETLNIVLLVVAILLHCDGKGIVITWILSSILMAVVNGVADRKLIGYGLRDQVKDFLFTGISVTVMYFVVNALSGLPINLFVKILIQIVTGFVVYFSISYFINRETLKYVVTTAASYIEKMKERKS